MWSNYGQKSLLVAVQSGQGHICFAKPCLLKMGCEISGWRFLKVWLFYAGFYCITRYCKARSRKVSGTFEVKRITAARPNVLVAVLCHYQSKTSKLQSTTCSLPFFVSCHQK